MIYEKHACKLFFKRIHELQDEIVKEYSTKGSKDLDVSKAKLERIVDLACEELLFSIFTTIDGVNDFHNMDFEFVFRNKKGRYESVCADFLHDTYMNSKSKFHYRESLNE